MEFSKFVEWAFYGFVSGCAGYGVLVLASLRDSVQTLNVKIAVVIAKTENHEKRLDKHDEQIEHLKDKN